MKKIPFLLMLALGLLTACGAPQAASTEAATATVATVPPEYTGLTNPLGADAAQAGLSVYTTNCVSCHGETGHGEGPVAASLLPHPADLAKLQTTASDDYLFWRISTGKPGTAMVGWKGILSDEQIWQVISLIRAMK
jgi:mono/diheme cytochrome c family protein